MEALPGQIENLESELGMLHATMADVSFYKQAGNAIVQAKSRLTELEQELAAAYKRWEVLEGAAE